MKNLRHGIIDDVIQKFKDQSDQNNIYETYIDKLFEYTNKFYINNELSPILTLKHVKKIRKRSCTYTYIYVYCITCNIVYNKTYTELISGHTHNYEYVHCCKCNNVYESVKSYRSSASSGFSSGQNVNSEQIKFMHCCICKNNWMFDYECDYFAYPEENEIKYKKKYDEKRANCRNTCIHNCDGKQVLIAVANGFSNDIFKYALTISNIRLNITNFL